MVSRSSEKVRCTEQRSVAAQEICGVILFKCEERLRFIGHLEASRLFDVDSFHLCIENFPIALLNKKGY